MVLALSPNYGVAHVVHMTFTVVILLNAVMYTTYIKNPLAEVLHNATDSYKVECYAFAAQAVGYTGDSMCSNYAFGKACWNVFQKMQLSTCASDKAVIFPAVGANLQSYGRLNDAFVLAICLLGALALGMLGASYWAPEHRGSLLEAIALTHFVMGCVAIALMATSALAMSQVTYNDNGNKGQTVEIGAGSVTIVLFPLIEIMLDATPTVWSKTRPDQEGRD